MSEETTELVNRIAASDFFRWYGYRFKNIENEAAAIIDSSGNRFVVSLYHGEVLCWQSGKENEENSARSKWIARVLNGASLECEAGQ